MKRFVQTRLDPVLAQGYYSTITDPDVNSLEAKKIRNSYLYFRTSSKPGAVEGIDVDSVSLDEYDRVPANAEASAIESMSSSPYKILTRWSTPSIENAGIHGLFLDSDQLYYMHKCTHCGYYNKMSYEPYQAEASVENRGNIICLNPDGVDLQAKTVVPGSYQYVCQKCGKPLDRWYSGEFVAKYPERTRNNQGIRGYSVSQMNAVWISPDQLKEKELNSQSKQMFYNYTLGFPYTDLQLSVHDKDVKDHVRPDLEHVQEDRGDYAFISAGVDWGVEHTLSIHGVRKNGNVDFLRTFTVRKANPLNPDAMDTDIQAIRLKLAPYEPDIIVADVGDSGDKVAKLIQIYGKDKVYGCIYPSTPKSSGNVIPTWSEQNNTVRADKLMQNKRYIAKMKNGEIGFYKKPDQGLNQLIEQWKNVVIKDEEDEDAPNGVVQKITRSGPDHIPQSSIYSMLGWERLLNVFNGTDDYGLDFEWMSSQMTPTEPDIFSQFV